MTYTRPGIIHDWERDATEPRTVDEALRRQRVRWDDLLRVLEAVPAVLHVWDHGGDYFGPMRELHAAWARIAPKEPTGE